MQIHELQVLLPPEAQREGNPAIFAEVLSDLIDKFAHSGVATSERVTQAKSC